MSFFKYVFFILFIGQSALGMNPKGAPQKVNNLNYGILEDGPLSPVQVVVPVQPVGPAPAQQIVKSAQAEALNEQLIVAVEAGHLATVEKLINCGADINANVGGRSAFHLAALTSFKHKGICELLLKRGAEVNSRDCCGGTALHDAAYGSELLTIQLLVDHGADLCAVDDDGNSSLSIARAKYARSLSAMDYEKKNREEFYNGVQGIYNTCLIRAVRAKNNIEIEKLLLAGAEKGCIAKFEALDAQLIAAAEAGDLAAVEKCLNGGADINAQYGGQGALHKASYEYKDICLLLLKRGAKVNSRGALGGTALYNAVIGRQLPIIKLLVEHGADLCVVDDDGKTPLAFAQKFAPAGKDYKAFYKDFQEIYNMRFIKAAKAGDVAAAERLLAAGADKDYIDTNGFSAKDLFKDCSICFDTVLKGKFIPIVACKHNTMCIDCGREKIDSALNPKNLDLSLLSCSKSGCKELMSVQDIRAITGDEIYITKYSELALRSALDKIGDVRVCRTPDCKGIYLIDKDSKPCSITCDSCKKEYCSHCCYSHSTTISCNDANEMRLGKDPFEAASLLTIATTSEPCVKCKKPIEKAEGCNHMTCKKPPIGCGHEYCIVCKGNWSKLHHLCKKKLDKDDLAALEVANEASEQETKVSEQKIIAQHGTVLGHVRLLIMNKWAWVAVVVVGGVVVALRYLR
jgi:ankyrin repeat protein